MRDHLENQHRTDAVVDELNSKFATAGFRPLARTREGAVWDLAYVDSDLSLVVARVTRACAREDYIALATMIAEGDFQRAILVYADRQNSYLSDEIETWHIDDIGELAAKLAAETAL